MSITSPTDRDFYARTVNDECHTTAEEWLSQRHDTVSISRSFCAFREKEYDQVATCIDIGS